MTTRITFFYESPNDPASFETDNPDLLAMARAIPGFQRMEYSRARPRAIEALLGRRSTSAATGNET